MKIKKILSALIVCMTLVCAMGVTTFAESTTVPSGNNSYAFAKEVDGYVRIWGQAIANPSESFVLKLYSNETLISTTTLNNVGNIINGVSKDLTWNFYYPESNDEYWTTVWEEGHPNSAAQPTKVVMYVDNVEIATTDAQMNGPDNLNPVKWRKLGGVAVADLEGEGTKESPYLINNIDELKWFRDNVNAGNNYEGKYINLTTDIDLEQDDWTPIGNNTNQFKGYFDGLNHIISNLWVAMPNDNYAGFFGYIKGNGMTASVTPTIQNLNLEDIFVQGYNFVGGLTGQAYTCKVSNVTVSGEVYGNRYVGGLFGHVYVYADNCHFIGDVTGDFDAIGGIAGAGDGRIYNSSVIGDVTGNNWVGGIIANGQEGTSVVGCYVKGTVSTGSNWYFGIGGIAGVGGHGYSNSVIKDNYFDGEVYLCGEKVNAIVVGLINAEDNASIGTTVEGNSWNTEYYSADTPVIVTAETTSDITPEDWAASASEEKSSVRNNNLVMLESDLEYVDAKSVEDVTVMSFSTVTDEQVEEIVKANNMVAQIGDTKYTSLEEALAAAQDGETVTLTWAEGDAPIAMNGAVYGKSVTITGTATVDWSQGYLFIGRGGAGNGTVIFDGANLTSASSTAAYGIHVSGREKDTDNKYDGTLEIKNSTIELDYLINRGTINVDNSTLTVKNGFGIAGRPASETESGEAATATINITNGSYVKVLNHNGMGIGVASATPEGKGILNLTDSTFECASFNIDADLGDFNVYGASTLKIDTLTGKEIDLHHNANIKDSTVGGEVMLYGKVTFSGDNTFAMLYDYGNAYSTDYAEWIVEKGASVTLTEKARYGLGYGDKGTVYGNLEDALTARENLTEDDISLFTHGLVAMSNWDVANSLTVKDAYVVIGSNNSFGNSASSNHKGTYDIDFENAVLDASRITFYAANSKTDFNFVDSDVKVGTFMTRDADSIFTLTNTKLLSTTTTNGTDEGNYHAGTLTLTKSDLTYSAPLVMENGTLTLDADSSLIAPEITGAGKISIDASEFDGTDVQVITADMSSYTGTIEVTGNEKAIYEITETGLIVKVIPELPTATVTELNADELGLTFALKFKADEVTDAQLAYYGDWYADFVLTVNKDVTFNANGNADGYLSGQYDAWSENWVNVPFEDVTLKAGESLKIMEYAAALMGQAGLKVTYNDVYTGVQDFDCGVFFTEEFLAANPDFEVTLALNMYNPEDETEVYAIGPTYDFEAPVVEETLDTKAGIITYTTTNAKGNIEVSLVAGIDSLKYSEVGFEVTIGGETKVVPYNAVYDNIKVKINGEDQILYPSDFGDNVKYVYGRTIEFPASLDGYVIEYRPYAIKLDGVTTIYGETSSRSDIYDGVIASEEE